MQDQEEHGLLSVSNPSWNKVNPCEGARTATITAWSLIYILRNIYQKKTTTLGQCIGGYSAGIGVYSPALSAEFGCPPLVRRWARPSSSSCLRGTQAAHHDLPKFQETLVSNPAFNIRPLIPAASSRPNTVSKKRVTTSWSLGESLWKHLASISPSFPVAVSGLVSPSFAPAQIGMF